MSAKTASVREKKVPPTLEALTKPLQQAAEAAKRVGYPTLTSEVLSGPYVAFRMPFTSGRSADHFPSFVVGCILSSVRERKELPG